MAYTDIDNPEEYFNTKLYTGNGTAIGSGGLAVTGVGFQPDWVWLKNRTTGDRSHQVYDVIRGVTKGLKTNSADEENTSSERLTAFGSDGFTVGNNADVNTSGNAHISFNWKAGTAFTNDASSTSIGDIDSSGSVNTDAGFSIIKATSDGAANKDIAHGLGAVPDLIISKNLERGYNWDVYFKTLGYNAALQLNSTAAVRTGAWGSNTFTTTTFETYEDYSSKSGEAYIYYCFAEKKGYSKFKSYAGNGNVDGPFIPTGFKPAMVIIKDTTAARDWIIVDNKRNTFNVVNNRLFPNSTDAQNTSVDALDFTAQGFKIRSNNSTVNVSGNIYAYMAFAENPFTTSTGIPATAR